MELTLKYPYLADENERVEAAQYFPGLLGEGSTKALRLIVGPYKDVSIQRQMHEYIHYKIGVSRFHFSEKGWLFKRRTAVFTTRRMRISDESMSILADTFYDVILVFGVKVTVEPA